MTNARKKTKRPSRRLIGLCRIIAWPSSRLFWQIEFRGTENIPSPDIGGFIIASNHQTYFDPVWISIPCDHDIRYLAWDQAFEWPILGFIIRQLGAIPVKLERGGTLSSLKRSLEILKGGSVLMIFPEGEREYSNGDLLPFRTGAVHLALKTGCPVLPVSISGGNDVWPQGNTLPTFGTVTITFHEPVRFINNDKSTSTEEFLTQQTEILSKIISSATKVNRDD